MNTNYLGVRVVETGYQSPAVCESELSASGEPEVIAPPYVPPSPPSGLVQETGDGTVTLTWPAYPNATCYNVYRALDPLQLDGLYELVLDCHPGTNTTIPQTEDDQCFKITALTPLGETPFSEVVCAPGTGGGGGPGEDLLPLNPDFYVQAEELATMNLVRSDVTGGEVQNTSGTVRLLAGQQGTSFNGDNEPYFAEAALPVSPLDSANGFSISAWVLPGRGTTWNLWVRQTGDSSSHPSIKIWNTRSGSTALFSASVRVGAASSSYSLSAATAVSLEKFHNVVLRYDKAQNKLQLWLNGVQEDSVDTTTVYVGADPKVELEADSSTCIDEVAMWYNHALTDEEIGQVFTIGGGAPGSISIGAVVYPFTAEYGGNGTYNENVGATYYNSPLIDTVPFDIEQIPSAGVWGAILQVDGTDDSRSHLDVSAATFFGGENSPRMWAEIPEGSSNVRVKFYQGSLLNPSATVFSPNLAVTRVAPTDITIEANFVTIPSDLDMTWDGTKYTNGVARPLVGDGHVYLELRPVTYPVSSKTPANWELGVIYWHEGLQEEAGVTMTRSPSHYGPFGGYVHTPFNWTATASGIP